MDFHKLGAINLYTQYTSITNRENRLPTQRVTDKEKKIP